MPEEAQAAPILVPLDLTPAGEVKIAVVEQYARALGARVLLLHVLRPSELDPANVLPTEAVARTYLDTVQAHLRAAGVDAEGVVRSGAPAPIIIEEALVHAAQLIVLGTNVRPVLSSAVLGSVADQVARAAPCPVLLVHPHGHLQPSHELRCFHEDAERAGALVQRQLGVRTIEVGRIIGSVDRCRELGLDFRPPRRHRRKIDEDRFHRIRNTMNRSGQMPPIQVYKLGFGYYVVDGHHRVAVALENGQVEIEANVTEYVPAADEQAPERFAARRAFERATGLTEVGAARPETYGTLLDAIQRYQQEQALDELPRAARRWFAEVFRPLWQTIRARELAASFPGDRSADLIARLTIWRAAHAPDLDWSQALERFVATQAPSGTSTLNSRNG